MRCVIKAALAAVAIMAACATASAASITGEVNLAGVGTVQFAGFTVGGPGTLTFGANGKANIVEGGQTGSYSTLSPCGGCVKFAPGSNQSTYSVGVELSSASMGNQTTYTYSGSNLPLFAINDGGKMGSFTPTGTVEIIATTNKNGRTSYIFDVSGTLTLDGFDPTEGIFTLTSQGGKSSFSATADAAPAPLAGAGLLSFFVAGLMAMRKRARHFFVLIATRTATA